MNKKVKRIIKKYRKKLKMTQEDLAKKLNVSPSMISYWETGKGEPDKEMIPIIANVLRINEKNFEKPKYKEQPSEFKVKFENILMFISIFIITFIMFSTISTLIINQGMYSNYGDNCSIKQLKEVDKEQIKEANKNLELIKNSKSKITEDDKKHYVEYLEKMKEVSEELLKNGTKKWCNDPKNNYERIIGLSKLKDVIIYGKDVNNVYNNYDTDISMYTISNKYNKIIGKKGSKNLKEIDDTKIINLMKNRTLIEVLAHREIYSLVFPKYKYINLNSIEEISLEPMGFVQFSYSEYYLELTKYIMQVGGINE